MLSSAMVIKYLKSSEDFVSGEDIAASLEVSRASVWKHIKNLRRMGFDISASTNKGYKLVAVPDIPSAEVLSSLLNTTLIGRSIEYHKQIASTNSRAMELGLARAPSGTVVTADLQTAGKARNGGKWPSPPGKNLYLSIVLHPKTTLASAGEVAYMALCSTYRAVHRFFPDLDLSIENSDLSAKERKLGGVLCEVCGEIDQIYYMALGIGLNVSHCKSDSGAESIFSLTGKMLSRAELTAAVLEEFEHLYLKWEENEPTKST